MGIMELKALRPLAEGDPVAIRADSLHPYAGITGVVERTFMEYSAGFGRCERPWFCALVALDNGASAVLLTIDLDRLGADV